MEISTRHYDYCRRFRHVDRLRSLRGSSTAQGASRANASVYKPAMGSNDASSGSWSQRLLRLCDCLAHNGVFDLHERFDLREPALLRCGHWHQCRAIGFRVAVPSYREATDSAHRHDDIHGSIPRR